MKLGSKRGFLLHHVRFCANKLGNVQGDDETLKSSLYYEGIGSTMKLTKINRVAKKPHEIKMNHKLNAKLRILPTSVDERIKDTLPIVQFYLSSIVFICKRTWYCPVGKWLDFKNIEVHQIGRGFRLGRLWKSDEFTES